MWKRLLLVTAVSAALSSAAFAQSMTVGFLRSVLNQAGAPLKPAWQKAKHKSAVLR